MKTTKKRRITELACASLMAVARDSSEPVCLRFVNRVYMARRVEVGLANLESRSGGADVGAAQEIQLPDLSGQDPATIEASAAAYSKALQALNAAVGTLRDNLTFPLLEPLRPRNNLAAILVAKLSKETLCHCLEREQTFRARTSRTSSTPC